MCDKMGGHDVVFASRLDEHGAAASPLKAAAPSLAAFALVLLVSIWARNEENCGKAASGAVEEGGGRMDVRCSEIH